MSIGIIISFILGAIVGFGVAWVIKKPQVVTSAEQDRNQKIIAYIRQNKEASNDDIQELLGIADSTATKYLQQLEDQGAIEQIGMRGRGVMYRLK
ncbi:hypothetical protein BK004_00720 [bacterium CG10_46_32]|nr:MAG: hypothetical protein BK004_00720 [bacterium CG10_46_32]PIR56419.1 MAG: hypothetical protein COU73_00725 [Parcubacteria group bacterium CG10_big_fil_rev_8_21_14_0_10_46_32]